jgi:hypothetical protein
LGDFFSGCKFAVFSIRIFEEKEDSTNGDSPDWEINPKAPTPRNS